MDIEALAGLVALLGGNIRDDINRIRDHLDHPDAIKGWLDHADEQLQQLLNLAASVVGHEELDANRT